MNNQKLDQKNNATDELDGEAPSNMVTKNMLLKAVKAQKQENPIHNSHEALWQTTARLAEVYFQNNPTQSEDIQKIIHGIFQSLQDIKNKESHKPAISTVSIEKSLTPDYIICLEDGKKLKMLKRHLKTNFNMTPHEYRAKWGLPPDYPMVAPNYANIRSQFAKKQNFGKWSGKKNSENS